MPTCGTIHRRHFPGLWRHLEALVRSGDLRASEEVMYELGKKDDDALAWQGHRTTSSRWMTTFRAPCPGFCVIILG